MSGSSTLNPDHALIREFLSGDRQPRPFDSNPLARALGAQLLAAEASEGAVKLAFEPGERFLQGSGCVQGGIVAAMLDFALAFAVMARLEPGDDHATASFSVNLLQPARVGRYLAEGRVQKMGARLAFASAALVREGGEPEAVATATGVMLLRRPRKR